MTTLTNWIFYLILWHFYKFFLVWHILPRVKIGLKPMLCRAPFVVLPLSLFLVSHRKVHNHYYFMVVCSNCEWELQRCQFLGKYSLKEKANASSQNWNTEKTLKINKTFCLLGSWDIESLSLPKQALYYYTACNAPLDIIIIMKEWANWLNGREREREIG